MFSPIFQVIQFIFGALLPLQITFEVIYLSKDWPIPILKTASYTLQQQKERTILQLLLLKFWAVYGTIYFIIPNSPFYFLTRLVPFDSILLTIFQIISLNEILNQFIKFIEEQDKIIALLQNFDNSSKSNFEIFSNIIFTTINLNNKDYIATSFLFGDYTKLLIIYTKTLLLPSTNYIENTFQYMTKGITIVKNFIQKEQNEYRGNHQNFQWKRENTESTSYETRQETNTKTEDSSSTGFSTSETAYSSMNRFWDAFKREYKKASSNQTTQNRNTPPTQGSSSKSSKNNTPDDYEIIDNVVD